MSDFIYISYVRSFFKDLHYQILFMKINLTKEQDIKFKLIRQACRDTAKELDIIRSKVQLDLNNQYQRLNVTYFDLFTDHFKAFNAMLGANQFNSAVVIARTMLEIFFKSFYFELIEQSKGTTVEEYLDEKRKSKQIF